MPSYRYLREIEPDDKPEEKKEYTKKEKMQNWWHYHWGWVAGGFAAVALLVILVYPIFTKETPDLTVGIVTATSFPDSLIESLQNSLAEVVGDRNGDGKAIVAIETFIILTQEDLDSPQLEIPDPNMQMAGVVRLTGAISSGDPILFLVDEAGLPSYQEQFGLFGTFEGESLPEDSMEWLDSTILWSESNTLSSLSVNLELLSGDSIDAQDVMSNFRFGIRPLTDTTLESKKNGSESWQNALEIFFLLKN